MSAESTNIDTQTKRHRPALVGIAVAVGFAGLLFVGYLFAVSTPQTDELDAIVTTPAEESQ